MPISVYFIGLLAGCLVVFGTILVIVILGTAQHSSNDSTEHSDDQLIYAYNSFFVGIVMKYISSLNQY